MQNGVSSIAHSEVSAAWRIIQLILFGLVLLCLLTQLGRRKGQMFRALFGHPATAIVLLLTYALFFGQFFAEYGLADLYWSLFPGNQYISGFVVALMTYLVFYTVWLVDPTIRESETQAAVVPNMWTHWRVTSWIVPLFEPYDAYIGALVRFLHRMAWPWLVLAAAPAFLSTFKPADGIDPKWKLSFIQFEWAWFCGLVTGPIVVGFLGRIAAITTFRWFLLQTWHHFWMTFGVAHPTTSREEYLANNTPTDKFDSLNALFIVVIVYGLSVLVDIQLYWLAPTPESLTSGRFWLFTALWAVVFGLSVAAAVWLNRRNHSYRASLSVVMALTSFTLFCAVCGCHYRWWNVGQSWTAGEPDRVVLFTAPVSIGLFMALILSIYAVFATRDSFWNRCLLAIVPIVWILIWNSGPYHLRFPDMDDRYENGPDGKPRLFELKSYEPRLALHRDDPEYLAGPCGAPPIVSKEMLNSWRRHFTQDEGKPKLVVVTTSGGATRASFWTAVVLEKLESKIDGFPKHVRVITGASGGMVGAACDLRHANDQLNAGQEIKAGKTTVENFGHHPDRPDHADEHRDVMSPIIARLVLRDAPSLFCPWTQRSERGRILDRQLARFGGEGFGKTTFHDFYNHEKEGKLPSIILSPMMVDDGRRLLISNLDVDALASNVLKTSSTPTLLSRSGIEFFRMFPEQHNRFKLATAVRMNATFPYISPSVELPTTPPRRIIDAGVFDNYGAFLAGNWIMQNVDWLKEHTSGVVLIQIRAFTNEQRLRNPELDIVSPMTEKPGTMDTIKRGLQFLTSPLSAVDSARVGVNYFRNDNLVAVLSETFRLRTGHDDFFKTVVFSCEAPSGKEEKERPPAETLSWTLNRQEYTRIQDTVNKDPVISGRIENLREWWKRVPTVKEPPKEMEFAKPRS